MRKKKSQANSVFLPEEMTDQKSLKIIEKIDKEGMLKAVEDFPKQFEEAISLAEETPLNIDLPPLNSILILGMGGSGISGDIIKNLLEDELNLPIFVNKGYFLPRFVNEGTLVFAVSYSGETEETLSGFGQVLGRGAPIISVSTGGTLAKKTLEAGLPWVKIPEGLQPRAALGYLVIPILVLLERLGLIKDKTKEREEALKILQIQKEKFHRQKALEENRAQLWAMKLGSKLPIVYGSEGITGVAAFRWKCQFNETSKTPSFWHIFPELNHNETVGWELLKDITQNFSLILLRDKDEPERVKKRIKITWELIEKQFGEVLEVFAEGRSKLAKVFSLIYFGDFVSTYLAILNGVDPTPVEKVQILKKKLKEE